MPPASADGQFPVTQWSLLSRIRGTDEQEARRALNDLCVQYHYPLYCYIRRRGLEHHDAQDALHDFFAKLLRNESLQGLHEAEGRMRGFLCKGLQRFLANWHRDHMRRRVEISLEAEREMAEAEGRFQKEQFASDETPERLFERKWAHELMQGVLRRLEAAYAARNRSALFQALRPFILAGGSLRGEEPKKIAASLGMSPVALRVAMKRLLDDYRATLRSEIAQTVENAKDLDRELAYLAGIFQRR